MLEKEKKPTNSEAGKFSLIAALEVVKLGPSVLPEWQSIYSS